MGLETGTYIDSLNSSNPTAGNGTAKPQGDDIVRSKTIAKVISTTVIKTYDDNSYLVPCVVMAC